MISYEISVYRREPETGVASTQIFTTARRSITDLEHLQEVLERFAVAFPDSDYETVIFEHESKTTKIVKDK